MKSAIRTPRRFVSKTNLALAALIAIPTISLGQNNLSIYADSLASGWQDESYDSQRNFANNAPVHSGSDSISVTITNAWGALVFSHANMTDASYAFISFWLNGGQSGGQQLQMYGTWNVNGISMPQTNRYSLTMPIANKWQEYSVSLSALGIANVTNFTGFAIQDAAGTTEPTFYVDDVQLVSSTPPALTHLSVNAGLPVRVADARWFGMNAGAWDGFFDTSQTADELTNIGTRALRFPGGTISDDYHWDFNRQDQNTTTWPTSFANFIQVVTNVNAQAMITVNYGTGSPNEAAAWVAYANASPTNAQSLGVDSAGTNWNTVGYWASLRASSPLGIDDGMNFLRISRAAPLGFKYWEIGNEVYGGWETDNNSVPHDPYTYALRNTNYISRMKAVDPTIKIGAVVTPGENSYVNNTNHGIINPRTGMTNHGWTPVLLSTFGSAGVLPDFVIHHRYPQNPGSENDAGLLQSSTGWSSDAANLRQQISDYIGSAGTNLELQCTENNSVSSNPGKQSTSLVNALFMADSLGQIMQTESNSLFWWDLRNQPISTGNMGPFLYGWRNVGDFGILDGTNAYPTYYTLELLQKFVQAGDTVITANSDYPLLSAYAVRRTDGSLTILVINKDPSNILTAQIGVTNFAPYSNGTVFSYGISQDNAEQTGVGSPDIAQSNLLGAGTNFDYSFSPYSVSVLMLLPVPAKLQIVPTGSQANQFVFQLQGQAGVPYIIQSSTDLITWHSVSTNTLVANSPNITNSENPALSCIFWRVVWQP